MCESYLGYLMKYIYIRKQTYNLVQYFFGGYFNLLNWLKDLNWLSFG